MRLILLPTIAAVLLVGCAAPKHTTTAPTPSITHYDSDPAAKEQYLSAFQTGYSDYERGIGTVALRSALASDPQLHGYADGAMLAMKSEKTEANATPSERDTILPKFSSEILPAAVDRYGELVQNGVNFRWHGF